MEDLWTLDALLGLLTLTTLEIVLGVDNIIFISILSDRLPPEQRGRARKVGLILALVSRILLLFSLSWMIKLTEPLFHLVRPFSGRDLILLLGGIFLIYKATHEIHGKLEGQDGEKSSKGAASFGQVVGQIMLLDIVFSLDSVITAVGMVDQFAIMVVAVVIAVILMLLLVDRLAAYVDRHPTIKMLALSFLLLIGFSLIGEGTGLHIPKGYIYFAMGFSVLVEMLNQWARKAREAVHLHRPY
jgi:predicted tellurium resistance membrane protein TerC